jgi:pyruvate carboxylase subunit B
MKYKFLVDKKHFDIEIANTSTFHSETIVKINKKNLTALIGDFDENETKSVFLNNTLYQIEIARDSEGYPVGIFVNGAYYTASLLKIDKLFYYKEKKLDSKKSGIMKSFIPGYIKKVYYEENDRVEEGKIVLIHEAMKMENEIRSPKTGIIGTLGVKEGDNVLANHLLFEVE